MDNGEKQTSSKRHYPPIYEKLVPIALGVIVFIIILLVLVIFGVALGLLPGSG